MVTTKHNAPDEAQRDRLMRAVGEGITQFAMVEIGLAHIYATMVGPRGAAAAWATFESARPLKPDGEFSEQLLTGGLGRMA